MSGDLIPAQIFEEGCLLSSKELAFAIEAVDFSHSAATVVGYGGMGRHYLRALRALRVGRIRVCSRSAGPLEELRGMEGVEILAGGFEQLTDSFEADELGIVAVPTDFLCKAARALAAAGCRRLLIEKPVSLWANEIERLDEELKHRGVDAVCAYNRLAYPSFYELAARVAQEGGIRSLTYAFTEIIKKDWSERFSALELSRWGIANSLHVIGMAHGLIGGPKSWSGYREGALSWHPAGAVFVGSGISVKGIPFTYHADWGSTGRWAIEAHTNHSSYRLCPLEELRVRRSPAAEWEPVEVTVFALEVKSGLLEQAAGMLSAPLRRSLRLVSLEEAAALTRYGEQLFGYA